MLILVLLVGWIASALFCAQVADEKGYSGTSWGIAGFIFGFFALIAVAGLPDKKLRKYIRQIGEKQQAIKPENNQDNVISENQNGQVIKTLEGKTISFVMPTSSNEEEMYKRLISEIARNKDFKKKFDKLNVESYEFSESFLGGRQFVLLGKDLRTLFVLTGKELNAIQCQWTGEF